MIYLYDIFYNNCFEDKIMYVSTEIHNLLNSHKCTYAEAEEVLTFVIDTLKQERDEREYSTVKDFLNKKKSYHVDKDIVPCYSHIVI